MASASPSRQLLVMGVHLASEGYPNTLYRLKDLRSSDSFTVSEINVPMWTQGTHARQGISRLTRNFWRALFAHVSVVFQYLRKPRPALVYVPYPGIFLVALLSFLPRRLKPQRIVLDAFISIHDTVVNDRKILRQEGLPAALLKRIEKRAYRHADKLIVDTEQNAGFLREVFLLPETKVSAVPLSTNEEHFRHAPYAPRNGPVRVLFIGTLIPLHGMQNILGAASLLAHRDDIRFKLIGDGQDAHLIASHLKTAGTRLEWERNWQSPEQLFGEISQADICLGIFGAGDKADRVCPLKIYAYAAVGRPVITGDTSWLRESAKEFRRPVFAGVDRTDPALLAERIVQLAESPAERIRQSRESRAFYEARLSNRRALDLLTRHLLAQ